MIIPISRCCVTTAPASRGNHHYQTQDQQWVRLYRNLAQDEEDHNNTNGANGDCPDDDDPPPQPRRTKLGRRLRSLRKLSQRNNNKWMRIREKYNTTLATNTRCSSSALLDYPSPDLSLPHSSRDQSRMIRVLQLDHHDSSRTKIRLEFPS